MSRAPYYPNERGNMEPINKSPYQDFMSCYSTLNFVLHTISEFSSLTMIFTLFLSRYSSNNKLLLVKKNSLNTRTARNKNKLALWLLNVIVNGLCPFLSRHVISHYLTPITWDESSLSGSSIQKNKAGLYFTLNKDYVR